MRTTVRVDDDLMQELKDLAHKEGISLAQLFNRTVRAGLEAVKSKTSKVKKPYREKTFNTGKPKVDLTKASQLAAELENEEIIKKMALGK